MEKKSIIMIEKLETSNTKTLPICWQQILLMLDFDDGPNMFDELIQR